MRFSTRAWFISGLLYSGYIIYATLLPFDFSFSLEMIRNGLGDIEWIERYGRYFYISKNVDAIANFFFFLPLGIIIFNARYAGGHFRHPLLGITITTAIGLVLSIGIESMQLLIEARRTSYIDIVANALGCFSGAMIAALLPYLFSPVGLTFFRKLFGKIPVYLFFLPSVLAGILLTDTLTLDFLRSEKVGNTIFDWRYIIQPIWIWRFLFFYLPLGILSTYTSRISGRANSLKYLHVLSFVLALAVLSTVEIIKYLLFAENILAVKFLFGVTGIIMGIAISEIIGNKTSGRIKVNHGYYLSILIILIFFFTSLVVYKYTFPFKLNIETTVLIDKALFFLLSIYSFLPFTGILKLVVFSLQNILLFIPLGILVMELDSWLDHNKKGLVILMLSLCLCVIPVAIQFFNLYQTPFMYEILINAIGLFFGYTIWYGVKRARAGAENEAVGQK